MLEFQRALSLLNMYSHELLQKASKKGSKKGSEAASNDSSCLSRTCSQRPSSCWLTRSKNTGNRRRKSARSPRHAPCIQASEGRKRSRFNSVTYHQQCRAGRRRPPGRGGGDWRRTAPDPSTVPVSIMPPLLVVAAFHEAVQFILGESLVANPRNRSQ